MLLMIRWTDGRGRVRLRRLAGRTIVGSGHDVDLRLDSPTVAARHAVLDTRDGAALTVTPLDPSAAIFRNGELCPADTTVVLSLGDRVGFGSVVGSICDERPVDSPPREVSPPAAVPRPASTSAAPASAGHDPGLEPEALGERLRSTIASVSPAAWAAAAIGAMAFVALLPLLLTARHVGKEKEPSPPAATPTPDVASPAQASLVELSALRGAQGPALGGGSRAIGFVVSEGGYLVSNGLALEGVTEVSIAFPNGVRSRSETVVFCSFADLALVRIAGVVALRPPSLAPTSGPVPGQVCRLVDPGRGGRTGSVRPGTVTRKLQVEGRWLLEIEAPGGLVAGAPVLNEQGLVVGVGAAQAAGAPGLGYAVPVEELHAFLQLVGLE